MCVVTMRTPLLVCLLVPLLSTARGQSLEAVVREAVESSFKMPRNMRKALIPAGRSRPPPLCSINSSESYFNILFGLSVKKKTSLLVGRHVFVFKIFIYLPSFFAIKKLKKTNDKWLFISELKAFWVHN